MFLLFLFFTTDIYTFFTYIVLPIHLLALRLKECDSKAYISAIKSSDDQVTTNPLAINDIFKGFYTNLYKAETDFDVPICKQYLDKLELPRSHRWIKNLWRPH